MGGLVDQVAFVDYNPWENVYESKENQIKNLVLTYGEECLFGGMAKLIHAILIINLNYLREISVIIV